MINKKAFTLIELIIVLSIIALLSSVLLPNIFKVQNKAKEAAVKAVLYNLQTELETYQLDHFVYPSGNQLPISELMLKLGEEPPQNPFSGQEYRNEDSAGQIYYSYDETTAYYLLTAYKQDGKTILASLTNK